MTAPGVATRQLAWQALRRVHSDDAWAAPVVDRLLARSGLDARDRAFAANLAWSAVRAEGTLDWMLRHVVDRPLEQVEEGLLDVLRLGAWELRWGAAPARATVATLVEVARRSVGERATGFVNGVLRTLAKRQDDLPWPDGATDAGMALELGYPEWIAAEARKAVGDRARDLLDAGNVRPELTLRALVDRDEVLTALAADGVTARPGRLAPEAVVVTDRVRGADLAVVADGRALVQDEASMVVARAAAERLPRGALALDLCAAPGGKATHLAQLGLAVVAADVHPRRAAALASRSVRLRLPVTVAVADGRHAPFADGCADVVLVDAPCSGLGVVRRRPELRWRRQPADVDALAAVQTALLQEALRLARPGGRVVYAVCTWTIAETVGVVGSLGERTRGTHVLSSRLLDPAADGVDGMFLAVLVRGGDR